jgi:hypothetical protein
MSPCPAKLLRHQYPIANLGTGVYPVQAAGTDERAGAFQAERRRPDLSRKWTLTRRTLSSGFSTVLCSSLR